MGNIHQYREYVDKENITFKGNKKSGYRYLLTVPLNNKVNKKILVIMKNPSKANKRISDLTINRVLTFCYKEGYSKVFIMNLYSYYATDSKELAQLMKNGQEVKAIGANNDKVLKSVLKNVDEIIVAWGSNTFGLTKQYKQRIRQVINLIKDKNLYYVEASAGKGWYPRHAQVWSVKSEIKKHVWTPPI
ncbi:DUF1643 domain-containing protein [Syntrophomonas wolfei]|jgi:hypothetical protein|uniref:DUF1643 domain-containing protein n=1 Tax=Syntrophomonas wolfei TaxID=863 RepID=UPI0023F3DDCC|nr:DUF1643 domain-containing protein [Syntrophomonas wolfei]